MSGSSSGSLEQDPPAVGHNVSPGRRSGRSTKAMTFSLPPHSLQRSRASTSRKISPHHVALRSGAAPSAQFQPAHGLIRQGTLRAGFEAVGQSIADPLMLDLCSLFVLDSDNR
jgi:hypothetical protein